MKKRLFAVLLTVLGLLIVSPAFAMDQCKKEYFNTIKYVEGVQKKEIQTDKATINSAINTQVRRMEYYNCKAELAQLEKTLRGITAGGDVQAAAVSDCSSDYEKAIGLLEGLKQEKITMTKATFESTMKSSLQGLAANNCQSEMQRLQQHVLAEQKLYPPK